MDSYYILTPVGDLQHSGIKGMRWGIRRYQNKDGSLTPAGRKRYNAETEKLKEREKTIKNQERTNAKLAKLDAKKAELDAREEALKNPNKAKADNDTPVLKPAAKNSSELSDKELQNKVNRLRNEEAYKDLNKKLGYDVPQTELDVKIAEMEKQKRYLELQRDIQNLTPEKVSRGKQLANKFLNEVIGPAVMESGKKVLTKYLTDSGQAAVEQMLKKEVGQAADKVTKAAQQQAQKEAKKAAKDAEKAAKKAAKDAEKQEKQEKQEKKEATKETKKEPKEEVYEGEVVGTGTSGTNKGSASSKTAKQTIDAEWWRDVSDTNVTSVTTTAKNSSYGKSYVSGYLNAPVNSLPSTNVAGYLPAPKDDD